MDKFTWQEVLQNYYPHFCQAAAEVGIDGAQLYQSLPASGKWLSGGNVPVLEQKYRGKCSLIFYINTTKNGSTWPYFKFMSFKHGGVSSEFNGLRCHQLSHFQDKPDSARSNYHTVTAKPRCSQYATTQKAEIDDQWRAKKFWANNHDYFRSENALSCPWLTQRLCGYANAMLLERVSIRWSKEGDLLVPISHINYGLIGYHRILLSEQNQKRHQIYKAGLLKGACIIVAANPHCKTDNIAICEGVITGLSLALVWPGIIYIALSAGNLKSVRQTVSSECSVTFFADNDSWKPEIGNTGIVKARSAALPGDRLRVPSFGSQHVGLKPTDFNDVLRLKGLDELLRQVQPY
jgi:putative DNA primase/helicase